MKKGIILTAIGSLLLTGCSLGGGTTSSETIPAGTVLPVATSGPDAKIPRAVVYRTNGDYNDNVAVTLSHDRTKLASYPAVGDVSVNSAPVALADGWLLDRRGGIGPNTAFLKWTYAEYSALPSTPSTTAIMEAVIPEARVENAFTLPWTTREALDNINRVDSLVRTRTVVATPK